MPQILKDKIAPALIPELFLSDFSDVPVSGCPTRIYKHRGIKLKQKNWLLTCLIKCVVASCQVHLQGKDRNTFATKAIDRSLLLNCNTETEIEGMLKGHLNIAQDSAVEVRWTYGSESTKADDFFFNWDLSTGLRTNIEAAGCIVVVFLTCHGDYLSPT